MCDRVSHRAFLVQMVLRVCRGRGERWTIKSSRRGWSGGSPCRARAIRTRQHAEPYPADPRDARFDALCALYLEADEMQRAQIPALFAREEGTRAHARITDWTASRERARNDLSGMILYMRRVASSIRSGDDARRLRLGLAAGAILQGREDDRDIIVSLAFLYHAARRAEIDPAPFFLRVAGLARSETGEFMRGFLERDEAEDVERMVEAFTQDRWGLEGPLSGTGARTIQYPGGSITAPSSAEGRVGWLVSGQFWQCSERCCCWKSQH